MISDLHMHSISSDGLYTQKELVMYAKEKKLDVIALTDHDTVLGIEEFLEYAKQENIIAIRGVEISSNYKGTPVHILAYFKDFIPDEAIKYFEDFFNQRRNRALKMAHLLVSEYNLKLDIKKLEENKGVLTRGNLIHELMLYNQGMDKKEAFDKYLGPNSKAYIKSTNKTPKEVVDYFRPLNCLLVIAHPTLYNKETCDYLFELPFDGIEAYYPRYEYETRDYFISKARERGWFLTAGSDFHGKIDYTHADLGAVSLDDENTKFFLQKLGDVKC